MSEFNIENRGVDESVFKNIVDNFSQAPSFKSFGIGLAYVAPGKAGLTMVASKKFSNIHGNAHFGISAALVDTAMGMAIFTLYFDVVTLEINLNAFYPTQVNDSLRCEGTVIHCGRTIIVAEGTIYNQKEKLVTKSRGTFYRIR